MWENSGKVKGNIGFEIMKGLKLELNIKNEYFVYCIEMWYKNNTRWNSCYWNDGKNMLEMMKTNNWVLKMK